MSLLLFLLCLTTVEIASFEFPGNHVTRPDDQSQLTLDRHGRENGDPRALDIRGDIVDEVNGFRSTLLEHQTGGRQKRGTVIEEHWTVTNLSSVDVGEATVLTYFCLHGEDYLIYGQFMGADGSYESEARFSKWDGSTFVDIGLSVTTYGLVDVVTHFVNNKLLLTFLNSRFSNDTYEGRSKFCAFDGESVTNFDVQQIATKGASSANYFDYEGETFVMVTNKRQDDYAKYNSEMYIFQYQGTYFDLLLSQETFAATDVVSFHYESFVYIVIGQFTDNDGNHNVGTMVYLFDADESQLKIVQKLETSGVVDLEIFHVGFETYLAVACHRHPVTRSRRTSSIIFWWSGFQFIRYQTIPTFGARSWTYQKLDDGDQLLILTHMKGPDYVTVFEFDDEGDWVETHVVFREIHHTDAVNTTLSVEIFEIEDTYYLALTRDMRVTDDFNTYETNFYYFDEGPRIVYFPPEDPLLECQDTLKARVNDSTTSTDYIMNKLNNTLKVYGPQEVEGPVTFEDDVHIKGNFTTKNLTVHGDHDFNIDPEFIAQVEGNKQDLLDLRSQFPFLVSLTEDETIEGYTVFQEVLHINHTLTGNISTTYFGGEDLDACLALMADGFNVSDIGGCKGLVDIEAIDENAIRLSGDQNVTGHVVFDDPVTVTDDITVENEINGLDIPDDLMLTYSDQEVLGVKTFDTSVTFESDVTVDSKVNDLDMTSDVVTTTDSHSIGGFKDFTGDIKLEDVALVHDGKTVDQVDLSEFAKSVILLDQANDVHGNLTFLDQSVMESNLSLANHMINEVNITHLNLDAVTKSTNQTITGAKSLRFNLVVNANVTVTGEVNGVDLSENVVPLGTNQTVNTPVGFGNISVGADIDVDGTVNHIDLSEDVVLTYRNQSVSGPVNFTQTVSSSANFVFPPGVEIDTVDVSELDLNAVRLTEPETLTGNITFEDPVKIGNDTTVDGLINDVNITTLDNQALSKSKPQTIPEDLAISANITLDGAFTVNGTVDGLKVSDFIPLTGDTSISGHKTFSDPMTVNANITLDEGEIVNCEDLTYLSAIILLRNGEQTVRAPYVYFQGQLVFSKDLSVDGLINGFDVPDDFVTLDGEQTINGKKIFATNPVTVLGEVNTTNLQVADDLQAVDVNDFYRDAVQNDTDTVISGEKSFDSITAENHLNVTGTIDGVDLDDFAATIVTLDGDQDITGNWTVSSSSLTFEKDVNVSETLNGKDVSDLEDRTIYKNKIQSVRGSKTIIGEVEIDGDLDAEGLINGLDIQELDREYLSKSRKQTLTVLKAIRDDASLDDLYLSDGALLDGKVPEDIALAPEDTTITVLVNFTADVKILGDLDVDGLINTIDIVLLNNTAVYRNIPQSIAGTKTFSGQYAVIGNITTPALVNGIDISELVLVAIGPNDTAIINAPIIFNGSVKILGNWNMTGLFHEVDLDFLMKDAMLTDTNQFYTGLSYCTIGALVDSLTTVLANKHFAAPSDVSINDFEVQSNLETDVISEGVSLEDMLNRTVTASTDQRIVGGATYKNDIILQDDMVIDGLLDGIDLSESAVLIEGEQTITSETLFEDGFTVNGNLSVTGPVDTVDLEDFDDNRVSLSKDQTIEGTWTFQDAATIENLAITGQINDIDPMNDPVYKDRNHTITGWKNWQGYVVIEGNADIPLVNGIDLYNISGIVLDRGTFVINDEKIFTSNVTIGSSVNDTIVTGLVDGISIDRLIWLAQYTIYCIQLDLTIHEIRQQQLCYPTYSLGQAAYGLVGALQYFEDWSWIENRAAFAIDQVPVDEGRLMIVSETYTSAVQRCIKTELHLCPLEEIGCHRVTDDDTLPASRTGEVFSYNGTTFVILTPSPQSVYCSQDPSQSQTVIYTVEDASYNATLETPGAVGTKGIEIEGEFYLIVAVYKNPVTENKATNSLIFKYNGDAGNFTLEQEIQTDGADSISTLYDGEEYWIAIGNGNGHTSSKIYRWSNDTFVESASIATTYASDVVLFSTNSGTYAVFANEMRDIHGGLVDAEQPITLYQYTEGKIWKWAQFIKSRQTIDIEMFGINDFWYMVAVSRQGIIQVFQWTYPHSFELFISFPVEGAERVQSFSQGHNLFLAITAPSYVKPVNATGGVRIVRAVIRGHEEDSVFVTS